MPTRLEVNIRKPLKELEEELLKTHGVSGRIAAVQIEGDEVVFTVDGLPLKPAAGNPKDTPRPRRRRVKRNRMKTRGWEVAGRVQDEQGHVSRVYKPFVEALAGKELTRTQQARAVREILVSNGNRPDQDSVEYFLDNTLRYLATVKGGSNA